MAAIFGCSGPELKADEISFFRAANPLGFILFSRNCISLRQIKQLTYDLRSIVGRANAPILIDQEGGRVQRLPVPPWRQAPSPMQFGLLDEHEAKIAVELNSRLIAMDLLELGIDVNCVPCLDVNDAKGHQVIGDRAYSDNPDIVANLGRAAANGLLAGGILPVIKHLPGHGKAKADSHFELPIVTASRSDLADRDFYPFTELADLPLGMTAHILFTDLDPEFPCTLSNKVISNVIRHQIGFTGLLLTDDISMHALGGNIGKLTNQALDAGCDVILHCNGEITEMRLVAEHCQPLSRKAQQRWVSALAYKQDPRFDSREKLLADLRQYL